MYSTYHFESASEVNEDIIESIKLAFKGKSIVITIEEENTSKYEDVPEWQKQIVLERQEYYNANPHELIEWEEAKKLIKLD